MHDNSNNNNNNYNYVLLLPFIIVIVDDASLAQVHRDTYNAPVVCFQTTSPLYLGNLLLS